MPPDQPEAESGAGRRGFLRFTVSVKPGSSRCGVSRHEDGSIVVRVHARPVDGAANDAVRDAIAQALGIARSQVHVLTPRGRSKIVEIPDAAAASLAALA